MNKKYNNIGKRKNLLDCDRMQYSAELHGITISGVIIVNEEDGYPAVFLAQDYDEGCEPDTIPMSYIKRKYNKRYTWVVGKGNKTGLKNNQIRNFRLLVDE